MRQRGTSLARTRRIAVTSSPDSRAECWRPSPTSSDFDTSAGIIDAAVDDLVRAQSALLGDVVEIGASGPATAGRSQATGDEDLDVVAEIKDIVDWLADLSKDVKKLESSSVIVNPNVENGWIRSLGGNSRYTLSGGKLTSAPVWGRSLYDPNAVNGGFNGGFNGGLNEGDVLIDIQPGTRLIRNVTFTPVVVFHSVEQPVVSEVESSGEDDPRIVEIRMEMNVDDDDL
jgi:hypothetical protein